MNRFAQPMVFSALALAAGLAASQAAQAAPEPVRPGVVGQIVRIQPAAGAVRLTHRGGRPFTAEPYQVLYNGDLIEVTAPAGVATVEFAGSDGGEVKVTRGRSPYRVTAHSGGGGSTDAWNRFVRKWGYVLLPPGSEGVETTTPRGFRGPISGLAASHYLPLIHQTISPHGSHVFPVVWQGQPATVTLIDGAGAVVAKAAPAQAGFALVQFEGALKPGDYQLKIGEQPTGPLVIQVSVAETAAKPPATHEEGALLAADALDGAPGGRLQALAELQALADKSYLAKAVMNAVQSGE